MLVFEILECGLFIMRKKRYTCMLKCGRNVLKSRRYDSVLSPLFSFFNLIKTAAKIMRTESVKCLARAVFAKSRARHVHIMSLNLHTSHNAGSPMFTRLGLPMNHYTISFFLQKTKTLSLALPTSNSS